MGGRRALVIIDVQNEFMDSAGSFPCPDASTIPLVRNLQNLIPRFRASGGEIIWVQALYPDRAEQPPGMKRAEKGSNEWLTQATHVFEISCCKPNTFGAMLYPPVFALAWPQDMVVNKSGYSAFWETDALKNVLKENIKEAFFAGLASNTCVSATIIDAAKLGFILTHAVLDCMGWRRYSTHEEAVDRLTKLKVVKLVNSDQVLCVAQVLDEGGGGEAGGVGSECSMTKVDNTIQL